MRALWLVLLAACAPASPEKLRRPMPIRHRAEPADEAETTVTSPNAARLAQLTRRPDLAIPQFSPDFHDELRWPLSAMNHPVLEPKFDIAQVFAQPGVGWADLCSSGVQSRYGGDKQLLSYLRGWCNTLDHDVDAACSNLVPLLGSTTPRLSTAVRNDLANILADSGHADTAEHFINVHHIRDVPLLDLLAANYVEVGTREDAVTINRVAMDSDDGAAAGTRCMRWARGAVLTNEVDGPLLTNIKNYATVPKTPDPTCLRLHRKLACWASHEADCVDFIEDETGDRQIGYLVQAYTEWRTARTANEWWAVVEEARLAMPRPGAGDIVIGALENAVIMEGECGPATQQWLDQHDVLLRPQLTTSLQNRLTAVVQECSDVKP